jgi:hypothetical protein
MEKEDSRENNGLSGVNISFSSSVVLINVYQPKDTEEMLPSNNKDIKLSELSLAIS